MAIATILLKGNGVKVEFDAGTAITPGYLIQLSSDGDVDPHATAAANAVPMWAQENELVGNGIDDDYAVGESVKCIITQPGSEIYAKVAASAPAIVIGQYLESAGDGTVRLAVTDAATDDTQRASIVGMALEAVDNSGGGTEARIRIMTL